MSFGEAVEILRYVTPDLITVFRQLVLAIVVVVIIQHAESPDDVLFCDQTGHRCNGRFPGAEALRFENDRNRLRNTCQYGIVGGVDLINFDIHAVGDLLYIFCVYDAFVCIKLFDHSKVSVYGAEALEEPENDRGQNDDCTGLLDEGPSAFPHGAKDISDSGCMIGGQFHDERSGIAGKELSLFQHDSGNYDSCNADEIGRGRNQGRAAEQGAGNQADDRHLRAARHKARSHDRHTAVPFVFNRPGGHDTGDAAAGTDQHRDKGFAGQSETAEDTVHDEGNTCHVTAVFQNSKHQEEDKHLRDEAQDRTDTGDDTV